MFLSLRLCLHFFTTSQLSSSSIQQLESQRRLLQKQAPTWSLPPEKETNLRSVRVTPCYSGCVILYYTPVINLDRAHLYSPDQIKNHLHSGAAYIPTLLPAADFSKSNFSLIEGKIYLRLHKPNLDAVTAFPELHEKDTELKNVPTVTAHRQRPVKELNSAYMQIRTQMIWIN